MCTLGFFMILGIIGGFGGALFNQVHGFVIWASQQQLNNLYPNPTKINLAITRMRMRFLNPKLKVDK